MRHTNITTPLAPYDVVAGTSKLKNKPFKRKPARTGEGNMQCAFHTHTHQAVCPLFASRDAERVGEWTAWF